MIIQIALTTVVVSIPMITAGVVSYNQWDDPDIWDLVGSVGVIGFSIGLIVAALAAIWSL